MFKRYKPCASCEKFHCLLKWEKHEYNHNNLNTRVLKKNIAEHVHLNQELVHTNTFPMQCYNMS